MKKKKAYTILLSLIVSVCKLNGQQVEIKVGDKCPDAIFSVVNFDKSSIKLSDFGGKLLILDFWATWCKACVYTFPKIDSLQKQFSEKIKILPVSYEDKNRVDYFLDRIDKVTNIKLISISNDSLLRKWFPHSTLPHYVWINQEGKVIAITNDGKDLSAGNIQAALAGEVLGVKPVVAYKKINYQKPLFLPVTETVDKQGNGLSMEKIKRDEILFHSILTPYQEGVMTGLMSGEDFGNDTNRITVSNIPVSHLYIKAFQPLEIGVNNDQMSFTSPDRLIMEVKDSSLLMLNGFYADKVIQGNKTLFQEYLWRYSYCYEIKSPATWPADKKFEIMLEDLNRFFGDLYGIKGSFEKRKNKCLTLVRTGNKALPLAKGENENLEHSRYFISISNKSAGTLAQFIGVFYLHKSIVDKTGIKENISINLNCDLTDLNAVNVALADYGLKIVESEIVQDMIVIKQVGKNNSSNNLWETGNIDPTKKNMD